MVRSWSLSDYNLGMIPTMQMTDVAPTVAALLGTSLPKAGGVATESLLAGPEE